jgi:hypothetical protein
MVMEVAQWTPIAVGAVLLAILMACVAAVLLVQALVRAGDQPTQGMLVVTLSLLSAGALVGGLAFNSDTALALAGTGFGALAGAVSAMFTSVHTRRDVEDRAHREGIGDEEERLP